MEEIIWQRRQQWRLTRKAQGGTGKGATPGQSSSGGAATPNT